MKIGDLIRCKSDNDIGIITEIEEKQFCLARIYVCWTRQVEDNGYLSLDAENLEVISESR